MTAAERRNDKTNVPVAICDTCSHPLQSLLFYRGFASISALL